MLKEYKFGFNIYGLLLFLIIMIPNFIWFAVPAPNDVLRVELVTEVIDAIASVCQVLMVISLCIFANIKSHKFHITPLIILVIICCLIYFASWVSYYAGVVNTGVILGLTISPCLAFMLFAIDRKNMIAVVSSSVFLICHLIYVIAVWILSNFIECRKCLFMGVSRIL